MSQSLLHFLDRFFLIFHTVFVLFNLLGWMWKKTRKIHLITIGLTLFSWGILGFWYGFGYCFCTDWHWDVRRLLGNPPVHRSYIQFLVRELTGIDPPYRVTADVTLVIFILLILLTVWLNIRDSLDRKKRRASNAPGAGPDA
ncbi:DUF2784 domain-containing protein [Salinispira pacifica]|uniref:DUF2784 domain-containing protein n=1 Tax=Salinispira pacifica TaxID=1307761 RepID=V5WNR3_9SPIO|nr:DUF2784 domain-containing protein [Salinispira pacifica]AHC16706.1 hypothetical protein L21SP2_3368 [Salinispira pacifica]